MTGTIVVQLKIERANLRNSAPCRTQTGLITGTWQPVHSKIQQEEKKSAVITPSVQKGNWGTKQPTDLPLLMWHVCVRPKSHVQSPSCTVPRHSPVEPSSWAGRHNHFLSHRKPLTALGISGRGCRAVNGPMVQHPGSAKELLSHSLLCNYNSPREVKFCLCM